MELPQMSACTSIESSPRIQVEPSEDHAIDESRTLFLGDLPSSATVEQISALFVDLQVSHVEIKIINSTKGTLCSRSSALRMLTSANVHLTSMMVTKQSSQTAVLFV